LLGSAVLARVTRRLEREERGLLWAAFLAHVLAVVVHVTVTDLYFGGGDAPGYALVGGALADLLRYDPGSFLEPVVFTLLQIGEPDFPFAVYGIGNSTGSMHAVAAFLALLTANGIYSSSLIISLVALAASTLLYFSFKPYFPATTHGRLATAVLLIPTTVFWNSGLLKEPLAVVGLSLAVAGFSRWINRRSLSGLLILAVGAGIVGLFKPYILFPTAVGIGLWYFVQSAGAGSTAPAIKPAYFLVGAVMALGLLVVLGRLFPVFALERVADTAAQQRAMGDVVRGGSYYGGEIPAERSLAGQLLFAPLALLTALFRPFLFEVGNAAAFVNALETTWLTILAARAVISASWASAWLAIIRNPVLTFCLGFVLVMATAVGLSTTNFGTLSRYRSPLVPFLGTLVLTLGAMVGERAKEARHASARGGRSAAR
jgi:hypothetical protein